MTATQEAAATDTGPIALMWSKRRHFDAILPVSVDVEAFLGTAAGALYRDPELMKAAQAAPGSLVVALMRCASLGHLPGTEEFYLTPRKKKGKPYVLGIEGYRGVVERMYRSGAVSRVVVREVCAEDKFRFIEGVDDRPRHSTGGDGGTGADFFGRDGSRARGAMVGVYAYAELATGSISHVVLLGRADILAARDSGGWTPDDAYSPWNRYDAGRDHPEFQGRSMWWKTGVKRLEPWVPTSAEYRRELVRASAAAAVTGGQPALPAAPPDDIGPGEIVDDADGQALPPAPVRATTGQLSMLGQRLGKLGVEDENRLGTLEKLAGRDLAAPAELTQDEAAHIKGLLDRCNGDRGALVELLATGQLPETRKAGDGDG